MKLNIYTFYIYILLRFVLIGILSEKNQIYNKISNLHTFLKDFNLLNF
jgi:hypothetical protein